MMRRLLILLFLLTFQTFASARGFFISPSGNDANAGTSQGAPWKTFAHAVPLLNAGDTLNLMNGTYTFGANGKFFADCNAATNPAHNGTATKPITIQAVNERQAWIKGDGSADSFTVNNCSYWQIIGIHASSQDNYDNGKTWLGYPFQFTNFNHGVVRRNLADHTNRYGNLHAMQFASCNYNLIEENEIYYFHRHGLTVGGGSNNEVRRNYANSRDYQAGVPPGGYAGGPNYTAFGISAYSAMNTVFENNISEEIAGGTSSTNGFDNEDDASNTIFYGNVAGPNLSSGYRIGSHPGHQSIGVQYIGNVSVHPGFVGFWDRNGQATFNHNSAFGTSSTGAGLFQFDIGGDLGSFPTYQFIVNNSTAQGSTTSSNGAYYAQQVTGLTFSYDHDNCYNDRTCYNPKTNVTNPKSANPAFGSCYLWVPASSPLHGAASDGGDIGANVLYQYVGGSLTSTKLWDSTTGAPLFAGATVAGLNDAAGSSLFDVANRLNINKNGCSFPAAYASDATGSDSPTALTAIVH